MLRAIYHPSYIPDVNWYKIQLLLWDKIYRIVPYSVESEFGKSKLAEKWNIPEEFVETFDIDVNDYKIFKHRRESIERQLKAFSKDRHNSFVNESHFLLNSQKIPGWLGDVLLKFGLRNKNKLDQWGAKHYLVRADASEFLMSCLAYQKSIDHAVSPLTNKKTSCFITYANQLGNYYSDQPPGESIKSLITGVFNFMVPEKIEKLSFQEVIDIRNEYADLRESASNYIKSLGEEFNLNKIVNKKTAKEHIDFAINKFKEDVKKFNGGALRRTFKDWKFQTIATTLGMLSGYLAGGPAVSVGIASTGASFAIMNHIAGRPKPEELENTIQYFSIINEIIDPNRLIRELNNYRAIVIGNNHDFSFDFRPIQ